jgi:ribosomal protein S18 acetylase RimI-like enzyme
LGAGSTPNALSALMVNVLEEYRRVGIADALLLDSFNTLAGQSGLK